MINDGHLQSVTLRVCLFLLLMIQLGCSQRAVEKTPENVGRTKDTPHHAPEAAEPVEQMQQALRAEMDAAKRVLVNDRLDAKESEQAEKLLRKFPALLQKANAVVHERDFRKRRGDERYKEHTDFLNGLREDYRRLSDNFEKKVIAGNASTVWKDNEGNRHALRSQGDGTHLETIITPAGETIKTTRGGKQKAAQEWTDQEGNRRKVLTDADGIHTETITTPDGKSVTTTHGGKQQASALWGDQEGNTHELVSYGDGTRTETIKMPNDKSVKTTHGGKQQASALWRDQEGNTHALVSNDDGTRTETITTPEGKTVTTTRGGEQQASALWKDQEGNTHKLVSNSDGTRTETIIMPEGKTVTTTRGGKQQASALWKDQEGNTHELASNDDGTRTETITTPEGKTVTTTRGGEQQASALWKDGDGNTHTLVSNDDGTRTETITTPQGKTVKTTRGGKQQASALWKDQEGNTHELVSNDDGTRTETITTPDGKSVTTTRGGEQQASALWKDGDGNTHTLVSNDDGTRTETITTPDGKSVTTTRGNQDGTSAAFTDEDGNTHSFVSNGDGNRTETITTPDGNTINSTMALSPHGNWYAEYHDYPEKGQVFRVLYAVSRQAAGWSIVASKDKIRLVSSRVSLSSYSVTPAGAISINYSYYIFGYWGGRTDVRQIAPNEMRGRWSYGEKGGSAVWRRAIPKVTRVKFTSEVISDVPFGAGLGRLEGTYQAFNWGPKNDMRGNRPRFRIEVFGKNLWGHHDIKILGDPALELNGPYYIYETSGNRTWDSTAKGISLGGQIWSKFKPGRKTLVVDGMEIPFDFIVKGAPEKPTLRFTRLEKSGSVVLETLPFYVPIYVEMEFVSEPKNDVRNVSVDVNGLPFTLKTRRISPRFFRSEMPFMLEPADVDIPAIQL